MISGQSLTCPKGASLTFEIDMDTDSDLTGATAQWALCESWFDQAKVYLTKTGAGDGLFIGQDAGVWKITVNIAPTDTLDIPSGLLYHDCKVLLQSGDVEDVANGPFFLDPSVNILLTNAPITRNLHAVQRLGIIGQTLAGTVSALARSAVASQTLGGLQQVASGIGVPNWFVDSVAGSDSTDGTTSSTPFASLAKLESSITSNPSKTAVALKRGSHFRESLAQSVTSVRDYGTGDVPIIDGSDVVTGWTVNGTYATVWEKPITVPTGGRPRVYENDTLMRWVADVATCATTAGSRVLLEDGGTITLQIHPGDSGNPNTNGKTYEATARLIPVSMLISGCYVNGLHVRRGISNNGSIQVGMDANVGRLLASDGSKHNFLVGSGSVTDTIAVRADDLTPAQSAQAYIVGFGGVSAIAGHSLSMTRCGAIADRGGAQFGGAFIDHGSTGGDLYDSVSMSQVWAVDCQNDFQSGSLAVSINGYYVENASSFCNNFADQADIRNTLINLTAVNNNGTGRSTTGLSSSFYAHFSDMIIYGLSSTNGLFRATSAFNGGDISLTNVAVYSENPGQVAFADTEGWSSGTLEINGSIFISNNGGSTVRVPAGVAYTANNNGFGAPLGSTTGANFKWHGGSALTGITAWRSASGQDSNSIEFNPGAGLFTGAGVPNGDFRLGTRNSTAVALTAIGAGPQHHWDWNARAQVSGAPARWPTIPRTLADAISYVNDPASWNWGTDSALPAEPDPFSFTPVTSAPVSTLEESNTITIAGLPTSTSTPVSVSGGQYSKNGGAYSSAATTAVNGDTFKVRQTSSASISTVTTMSLTVGGVVGTFSVTTSGGAVNLLVNPATFTSSPWEFPADAATVSHTGATDSQGGTSYRLVTTTFSAAHGIQQQVTASAGTTTVTIEAKYVDNQWVALARYDSGYLGASFDIQNGLTGAHDTGISSSITSLSGGWYRLTASFTTSGANPYFAFFINSMDGIGVGGSIEVWTPSSPKSVDIAYATYTM